MHYRTEVVYTRALEAIVVHAERVLAQGLGWVPCDFPHGTIVPADIERARFAYCPLCKAAV